MRIEFLTQDDPLYIFPFFDEFIRNYADEFSVISISAAPTMGRRSRVQMLRELTQLYGVDGVVRLVGRILLARIVGILPKAKGARSYATLSQLSRAYEIPYRKIDNPNSASFLKAVQDRNADLLISVACPFILKEPLLKAPRLGAINIHHAPLPQYKGMMPTFWQMYHREKSLGISIHYMAPKIDEGDVIYQDNQPIEQGESLHRLILRTKRHGAHCMAKVLRQIQANSIARITLDHSTGTYFTFPTRTEIAEFRRQGFRAI